MAKELGTRNLDLRCPAHGGGGAAPGGFGGDDVKDLARNVNNTKVLV